MQFREFVTSPENGQHIVIRPEPHPKHYIVGSTVSVPEGGSTLVFIVAALTAIGWAATKRYYVRVGGNATPARIAS